MTHTYLLVVASERFSNWCPHWRTPELKVFFLLKLTILPLGVPQLECWPKICRIPHASHHPPAQNEVTHTWLLLIGCHQHGNQWQPISEGLAERAPGGCFCGYPPFIYHNKVGTHPVVPQQGWVQQGPRVPRKTSKLLRHPNTHCILSLPSFWFCPSTSYNYHYKALSAKRGLRRLKCF